jgi:hypothetical protein
MRLFQNFSFWNSFLGFSGKTGLLAVFSNEDRNLRFLGVTQRKQEKTGFIAKTP